MMPLPVNCLSLHSKHISQEAVANQRTHRPGSLTFTWDIVDKRKEKKGGKREKYSTKKTVEIKLCASSK